MDLVQDLLRTVARQLTTCSSEAWVQRPWELSRSAQLQKLGEAGTADTIGTKQEASLRWTGMTQAEQAWPRISYTEAIDILTKHKDRFKHQPLWGLALQTEHEKFLALEVGGGRSADVGYLPVFITHYPRDIKPFYMLESPSGQRPATVECFDLIVPEMGELVGGSLREHRFQPLQDAMSRSGINLGPDMDWYLDLRRWGCPPHGGFGLGFDRLLSYLSTIPNVRDVATFPRWPGRCDC